MHKKTERIKARLFLEDGSVFYGLSFGALKSTSGEVVFNTGMVGYPESMTDPSYRGQILVFTYPLIGNYGVPEKLEDKGLQLNFESEHIHARAIVVSDYSFDYSHWNAKKSLAEWMEDEGVPGIFGIDTRELTKKLREKGTMIGKVVVGSSIYTSQASSPNPVDEVSVKAPLEYSPSKPERRVALVDCGAKHSIIRSLLSRNFKVLRVPWDYDFTGVGADGIFISNGPGDPKSCGRTIYHIKKALGRKIPIMGICLGNQLLGLAAGADTYKLKYGHRSQNQPCIQVGSRRCYITSQNHGYAIASKTLPKGWRQWFVNGNDGTNEGIIHDSGSFCSVQFHPEAAPGPLDTGFIFDLFAGMMGKK